MWLLFTPQGVAYMLRTASREPTRYLIPILLFLILTTLLGVISVIGVIFLIYIGLFITVRLLSFIFSVISAVTKGFSDETMKAIMAWLVMLGGLSGVVILNQNGPTSEPGEISTPIPKISLDTKIESPTIYKYILKDLTNVRICGSLDCLIIGQYPAMTEFEFNESINNLPEWIRIQWIDNVGVTQYGYIHWSAFNISNAEAWLLRDR